MKISEVIKELQRIMEKDGDIEVKVYPYDGQLNPSLVEKITEAHNTKVIQWNDTAKDWDRVDCNPFIVISCD